jgi:hypothetical protein
MKNKIFVAPFFGGPALDAHACGGAKSFGFHMKLAAIIVSLVSSAKGQFEGAEDFSSALRQEKWFPFTKGVGSISLSSQEFNFTSSSSVGEHEAGLSWVNTPVRYSEDWEFQLDVANALNVSNSSRYAATGIYVANGNDDNDLAYLEFYGTYFDDLGRSVRGFTTGLSNNGTNFHEGDTFELPFDTGALRAKFDSSERSLTFYFLVQPRMDTSGKLWRNTDWMEAMGRRPMRIGPCLRMPSSTSVSMERQ